MSEERTAWGWGLASVDAAGTTLGEAFKLHPADGDSTTLIKDTQTIVDLEAYQGKTLVFYVVACPADGDTTVLRRGQRPADHHPTHRGPGHPQGGLYLDGQGRQ